MFNKNFVLNFPAPSHFFNQNQGSRAAFMTTSEWVTNQGWYLNSGTTHHLTNTVQNLNDGKIFFSSNLLIISNGQGLQITHIGYTCLYTFFGTCLHLHNVLYASKITKNLINVSKLLVIMILPLNFSLMFIS